MTVPFVAGKFTSAPVRVHAYTNVGKYMLVDENNTGCWTDPEGRVLLPSLELVDRVLKAHGYARDEMIVRKIATLPEPTEPTPQPEPESPPASSPSPEPPASNPPAEKPSRRRKS